MKFLQEIREDVEVVVEDKEDGKKHMYIHGVFLQCIPNRNGRIYPESVMHKEVNRYIKEAIDQDKAVGELSHPTNPQINLDRISHKIISLKIEGKDIIGKAKLLDTPCGNIAKGLINGGVKLGVSSRGLGSLKEIKEGLKEVQDDFRLITAADIVSDPSAPQAWVDGIMENVEYFIGPDDTIQRVAAEAAKKEMKKMSLKEIEETKLRLLSNYLKSI